MSARYFVVCNGCATPCDFVSEVSLAYARLAPGWTHPKAGQDFCPKCSEARTKAEKERNPHGYL